MKKLFTLFCAVALTPTFSVHAWTGGPFSNNSYFGAQGDDGVYEAVGTAVNGLGLYRLVVGNNFQGVNPSGVQASVPSEEPNTGTIATDPIQVPGINSGNIFFGGLGNNNNCIWYYQGVAYFGQAIGTVNSSLGFAAAVGNATEAGGDSIGSFFQASIRRSGPLLPAGGFEGTGEIRVSTDPGTAVPFTIFGSKVSDAILFGL